MRTHTTARCRQVILGQLMVGMLLIPATLVAQELDIPPESEFTGSQSCRECHERFHGLWSTSWHGLAMQPYTAVFAANKLTAQAEPIQIGDSTHLAFIGEVEGFIRETRGDEVKDYPIVHVLGGKNTYFFLTLMERGRLQTMALGYEVHEQQWYDMAGMGVRHFGESIEDEPYHWTEPPYTFNTSCYECHVSQLSNSYDLKTDTYSTTWKEAGINCETCHGPASEHIRVCQEAKAAETEAHEDLKMKVITQDRGYTTHQANATCSTCHAKGSPITRAFELGDDFYNHYDIVTLENLDYYPDGRDLGENYTYTSWRMNPCVDPGNMDCLHCHTSSGRYRFQDAENPNAVCLPCHQERVENAPAHTHHPEDTRGNHCISCHMPETRFANMNRSDHSFRPPMPSLSKEFSSPLACLLCHPKKDTAWAENIVDERYGLEYQLEPMRVARLLHEAREETWDNLQDMLAYLEEEQSGEIYTTSFVRALRACPQESKWAVFLRVLEQNASPLVRASVADALGDGLKPEFIAPLLNAMEDPYRLVRIRAASSLAPALQYEGVIPPEKKDLVAKSVSEFKAAMDARPDDWASHYNLGNFLMSSGDAQGAIEEFELAVRLRPDALLPLVNATFAYNSLGKNDLAEASLRKALEIAPEDPGVLLNLGLLLGELGRKEEAEQAFRETYQHNPDSAAAAFNLSVLLAEKYVDESLDWSRKSCELAPENANYAYTLAFYLRRAGHIDEAVLTLQRLCASKRAQPNAYWLLGDMLEKQGELFSAKALYENAAHETRFGPQVCQQFSQKAASVKMP